MIIGGNIVVYDMDDADTNPEVYGPAAILPPLTAGFERLSLRVRQKAHDLEPSVDADHLHMLSYGACARFLKRASAD